MNNLLRLLVVMAAIACAIVVVSLGFVRHDAALLAPVHLALFVLAVVVYLFPAALAMYRDCRATAWIVMLNVFLGWTIAGWFAALGWAVSGKAQEPHHSIGNPPTHPVPGH